jgi:hypothetical protein
MARWVNFEELARLTSDVRVIAYAKQCWRDTALCYQTTGEWAKGYWAFNGWIDKYRVCSNQANEYLENQGVPNRL